jgi:hypothetical protein
MNTDNEKLFYFGCIREPGHYLWASEHMRIWESTKVGISQCLYHALDGAFCPIDMNEGQRWICSIVPPWTIVAWWDRSIDRRPNCVSAFIGKGFGEEPNRLLDEARRIFPKVFLRQPRQLEEYAAQKRSSLPNPL